MAANALNRASSIESAFETGSEANGKTEGHGSKGNRQESTTPELDNLPRQLRSPDTSRPIQSAFDVLPSELLVHLAYFVASKPVALMHLSATCSGIHNVLAQHVEQYAVLDQSRKVSSLQSFMASLKQGVTGPKLFTFEGELKPFRAVLLATLGNRILALPSGERDRARQAFIKAVNDYDGKRPPDLENALNAANQGLAFLQGVEYAAVTSSLPTCGSCGDLATLKALAADLGVCSSEGLDRMKIEAARNALSSMGDQQACALFEIPLDGVCQHSCRAASRALL